MSSFYRQGDRSEGGESNTSDNQSHTGDQEEAPQQTEQSVPANKEESTEEREAEQDGDKSQLSPSVIIEVPNVQSSLELSTITGNGMNVIFR